MPLPIRARILNSVSPQITSSLGLRVRIAADSFIPWEWVKFPEPPPGAAPGAFIVPVTLANSAFDFFVHGDGRMPASRSDHVGSKFRTQGMVEVDVIEQLNESFGTLAQSQPSKSELRLATGRVLHTQTGKNPVSSTFTATRIHSNAVHIEMIVSGAVPWNVAGPQPAIDLKYSVDLAYDPGTRSVEWKIAADHDGFPGHEIFIESAGLVRFNKSYLPSWFSSPSTGTCHPSMIQAMQGAAALGGINNRQTWIKNGSFDA